MTSNFYSSSRRSTARRSSGATPTRTVASSNSSTRNASYGPGQDLRDFDLPDNDQLQLGFSSGSEDGGDLSLSTPETQHFTSFATPLSRPRVGRNTRNDDMAKLFSLPQKKKMKVTRDLSVS